MSRIYYLRYIEQFNFAAIRYEVREANREDHGGVLRRADGQAHHVPARAPQDDHLQRGPGREARLACSINTSTVSNVPVIFRIPGVI